MNLVFHPGAAEELSAAVQMYEDHRVGLGRALGSEAKRVASMLRVTPAIGEPLDTQHRRIALRRFPFGLIYRVDGEVVQIIAVAHRRRLPGYWRARTRAPTPDQGHR